MMSEWMEDAMNDDDMRTQDIREKCPRGAQCQFQASYDGYSSCQLCGKTNRDWDEA